MDLGLKSEDITARLVGLGVSGWRFAVSRAERHAIVGTHVEVVLDADPSVAGHGHAHRALGDIEAMIERAPTLSAGMKARARKIFRVIGEAEAKVHGTTLEQVHFHEVGAVDSIVDICGAAVVLELLGDPEVFSAPPPLGSGRVKTAHGNLPIPPPATLEILRDVPVRFEGVGELVTPTGAGILRSVATVAPPPEMVIERVGYGVGTKDFKDRPNVLRGSLGVRAVERANETQTYVLEANVDDATPQLLGHVLEALLAAGALDAWIVPALMKKGRPGHLVAALTTAKTREAVLHTLLTESTTLGVRFYAAERIALARRFVQVSTRFGEVAIKLGELEGKTVNAQPEFEDCRVLAARAGVAVKDVLSAAVAAYEKTRGTA